MLNFSLSSLRIFGLFFGLFCDPSLSGDYIHILEEIDKFVYTLLYASIKESKIDIITNVMIRLKHEAKKHQKLKMHLVQPLSGTAASHHEVSRGRSCPIRKKES